MRQIDKIIIHCSATKEGAHFTAKDIDQWHQQRGWTEIGYHYVILLDGTVEKGRDVEKIGAHTKGYNENSIGLCYIGGLDKDGHEKDTRTKAQIQSMKKLIKSLQKQYPQATLHGHYEFSSKACPCFDVKTLEGKKATQKPLGKSRTLWGASVAVLMIALNDIELELEALSQVIDSQHLSVLTSSVGIAGALLAAYARIDDRKKNKN